MAEVAGVGVLQSLPSVSQSLLPAHGAQCALLSLPSIVWLLSNGCKESGRERKGRKKVKIK